MPLEKASGVGKVSSTQKPKAIGDRGIAKKPRRARLMLKRATFFEGKVNKIVVIRRTAAIDTDINTSLNLCVLSKKIPATMEPKIPEMIKIAPNSELFWIV